MYLICTPLFYSNDKPHIGHKYTASVVSMYSRLLTFLGSNYIVITGNDEHGEKVYKSYLDFVLKSNENKRFSFSDYLQLRREQFESGVFKLLGRHFPYYTDLAIHKRYINFVFQQLQAKGAIYKAEYKGYYSIREERYIGSDEYKVLSDEEKEMFIRERYEPGYFLKLGDETKKLIADSLDRILINDHLVDYARQLVLSANDVFITRQANEDIFKHSIKVESDPAHAFYVWFDAILYYSSILRTYTNSGVKPVIVIGKDILSFHISLLSHISHHQFGDMPYRIAVHGMINDGADVKVSKSHKNSASSAALEEKYGPILFSYLLSCGTKNDIRMSEESVEAFISFLKNNVRNCYKRYFTLFDKYIGFIKDGWVDIFINIFDNPDQVPIANLYTKLSNNELFTDGADLFSHLCEVAARANQLITAHELWKVSSDKAALFCVLGNHVRTMMMIEEVLGVPGAERNLKAVNETLYSSVMVPMKVFEFSSVDIKIFDL